MSLTILIQNEISFRAKSRKNGIYVHKGIHYLVKDNQALYYLCQDGSVLANYGNFNVSLGKIEVGYGLHKQNFQKLAKENQWL